MLLILFVYLSIKANLFYLYNKKIKIKILRIIYNLFILLNYFHNFKF